MHRILLGILILLVATPSYAFYNATAEKACNEAERVVKRHGGDQSVFTCEYKVIDGDFIIMYNFVPYSPISNMERFFVEIVSTSYRTLNIPAGEHYLAIQNPLAKFALGWDLALAKMCNSGSVSQRFDCLTRVGKKLEQ